MWRCTPCRRICDSTKLRWPGLSKAHALSLGLSKPCPLAKPAARATGAGRTRQSQCRTPFHLLPNTAPRPHFVFFPPSSAARELFPRTPGCQQVVGIEHAHLPALSWDCPAGSKVRKASGPRRVGSESMPCGAGRTARQFGTRGRPRPAPYRNISSGPGIRRVNRPRSPQGAHNGSDCRLQRHMASVGCALGSTREVLPPVLTAATALPLTAQTASAALGPPWRVPSAP
jgi:hypothetical protein